MNKKELQKYISEEKKEIEKLSQKVDYHSKEFDKRINRLLANL